LRGAPTPDGGVVTRARRANGNGHAGVGECHCPLCFSVLAPDRYAAVVGSLSARESEIEQTISARFTRQIADAERKRKVEIDAAVKAATKALRDGQAGIVAATIAAERERSDKVVAEAVNAVKIEFATEKARLETTLAEEKKTDATLTKIAENNINQHAQAA